MNRNRVVVTGMGVLAANGIGLDDFWGSLCRGESGTGPATLCDVTGLPSKIAGEVADFNPDDYLNGRIKARRLNRSSQMAVAGTKMALEDAGVTSDDLSKMDALSILFGVSMGGFDFIEREIRRIHDKGAAAMRPSVIGCINLLSATAVAQLLGIHARLETFSDTCTGGMNAVAEGARQIRDGEVEMVIAGGANAPIETSLMAGFCSAGMLSTYSGDPAQASRPFDKDSAGGVLAEGAGIVVVEELQHALARGAVPYAEIAGWGASSDPCGQDPASGLALSMREALQHAGWLPSTIDLVNAHGPSDPVIDRIEMDMLKEVLGDHAFKIPVHSIKGSTGNPLAAAAGQQLIATALAFKHGIIPPTCNHEIPAEGCDLDIVHTRPARMGVRRVLINSHGLGSVNSTLLLEKIKI